MTRQDHERLAEWDAAYVLGALSPADRRLFEEHMQQCRLCHEGVNELSSIPGLLAQIRPAPEAGPAKESEGPPDFMDAMRRTEHRRRAGRRWWLGAAAAAAAVVLLIAVPAALMLRPSSDFTNSEDVVSVALEPVESAVTSMSVEVTLAPAAWGTQLAVECAYPTGLGYREQRASYALIVTDSAAASTQVSTWKAVPGETVALAAATAVSLEDIATLTVVTADGEELLTASLPPN